MISTHVLDTSRGVPAVGVPVRLRRRDGDEWTEVARGMTDNDGRHVFDSGRDAGIYQLLFEVEDFVKSHHHDFFFPKVPVVFKVTDTNRKYHVPLLLSPFGYSTYRGS